MIAFNIPCPIEMISCLILVDCSYRCILWFQIGIKSDDYHDHCIGRIQKFEKGEVNNARIQSNNAMGECHIAGEQDDNFQPTPGAVVQSDKVVVVREPLKLLELSEPDRHSCEIDKPFPFFVMCFQHFPAVVQHLCESLAQ